MLRTRPCLLRTTRSASAPGQSVPFFFSIPRHLHRHISIDVQIHTIGSYLAGLYVAHLIASPREHPVNREKLRTHLSKVTTLSESKHQYFEESLICDHTFLPKYLFPPNIVYLPPSRSVVHHAIHRYRLAD